MSPISSFPPVKESVDEHVIGDEYLTDKEKQQLLLDEEALIKTLEEESRAKKERKERIRQKQAHDELSVRCDNRLWPEEQPVIFNYGKLGLRCMTVKSEFCLVTGFACGKLVFHEYMDNGIPPFLRRVFPDKAKNLENKASLGKAAQDKVARGKATKGKAAKSKDAKRKAAQGKAPQPSNIESEVIPRCLAWTRRKGFKKRSYPQLFRSDSNLITHIRPDLKKRDENWYRKMYDYVACKERSEQATSVCDDIDETDTAADDNAKAMSVCDDIHEADAAADDNAKAMSVCDDIHEADAAADDNAKVTNVHDDIGVSDAAADDNAKAMSVCDDINEANAAANDDAKAMSVHDDVGVPDVAADDNAKATSVCDDVDQVDAVADDNAKVLEGNSMKEMYNALGLKAYLMAR
uniref:Uncharacterized protein n=1 Tax=Tanacetum cinerariifolium TaxID=118510 RepID=A0A6L2LCI3_TANCI|nr:hypothetical protein [Tanacetum cinerariifolium]